MSKVLTYIEQGSDAWNLLWEDFKTEADKVYRTPSDCSDLNKLSGECWQYMGTYDERHEFRHRHHPDTGQREYVHFYTDKVRREAHERMRTAHRAYYGRDWDCDEVSGAIGAGGEVVSDADPGL